MSKPRAVDIEEELPNNDTSESCFKEKVKRVHSSDLREFMFQMPGSRRRLTNNHNMVFGLVEREGGPEIVTLNSDRGLNCGISQETWTCQCCTYVNTNMDFLQCEICGGDRKTNDQGEGEEEGSASCSMQNVNLAVSRQLKRFDSFRKRATTSDRLAQITRLQGQILTKIGQTPDDQSGQANGIPGSPRSSAVEIEAVNRKSLAQRARLIDGYIQETERILEEEHTEQEKVAVALQSQRKGLERGLGKRDVFCGRRKKNSQQTKLLDDWRNVTNDRGMQMLDIHNFQNDIWDKVFEEK